MSTTIYRLTPPQATIFKSKKRFKIVNAGRRFGKTWLSGACIMDKAINYGKKIILYIAPTSQMAKDLMWDTWLKEHIPPEYIEKKNEQYMTMEFKNGSIVYCLSADKPDRLAGKKADLMIVDECALIGDGEHFFNIIQPILADKYVDGEALYISTPRGYNWFYKIFCKARENPNSWDCFEYTTMDGGNVAPEEIEEMEKTMSAKEFKQELYASFTSVSDRVYESYDQEKNHCEKDENWGYGDIHVGMDFNIKPMTAVISVIERGSIYIFDEIHTNSISNTQEVCDIIKRRYPEATVYVYPDPTAHRGQTNAPVGETDFSILQKNGFIVCAPRHSLGSKDKYNTVNTALCNASGVRHVFLDETKCVNLKESWNGYAYKENGDTDKSTGLDHIADAAAYLITYRLPYHADKRITKPKVLGV